MAYNNYYEDWYTARYAEDIRNQYYQPYFDPNLQCQPANFNRQPYENHLPEYHNIPMPRNPPSTYGHHSQFHTIARGRWNWRAHYGEMQQRGSKFNRRKKSHLDDVYGPNFEEYTENDSRHWHQKHNSERQTCLRNITQSISSKEKEQKEVNTDGQKNIKNETTSTISGTDLPISHEEIVFVASESSPVIEGAKADTDEPSSSTDETYNTEDLLKILTENTDPQQNKSKVEYQSSILTSSTDITDNSDLAAGMPSCKENSVVKITDSKDNCIVRNMRKTIDQPKAPRKTGQTTGGTNEKSIVPQKNGQKRKYRIPPQSRKTDEQKSHSISSSAASSTSEHRKISSSRNKTPINSKLETKRSMVNKEDVSLEALVSSTGSKENKMECDEEIISVDKIDTAKSYLNDCPTDYRIVDMEVDSPIQKRRKIDNSDKFDKVQFRRNSEQCKNISYGQKDQTFMRRASLDSQLKKDVCGKLQSNDEHSKGAHTSSTSENRKTTDHTNNGKPLKNTYSKNRTSDKNVSKTGTNFKIPRKLSESNKPSFSDAREQFRNGMKHIITTNKMTYLFGSDGSDDEQKTEPEKIAKKVHDKQSSVNDYRSQTKNIDSKCSEHHASKKKRMSVDETTSDETKTSSHGTVKKSYKNETKLARNLENTHLVASKTVTDKQQTKAGKNFSSTTEKTHSRNSKDEGIQSRHQDPKYPKKKQSFTKRHSFPCKRTEDLSIEIEMNRRAVLKKEAINRGRLMYVNMSFVNTLTTTNSIVSKETSLRLDLKPLNSKTDSVNTFSEIKITETIVTHEETSNVLSGLADFSENSFQETGDKDSSGQEETEDIKKPYANLLPLVCVGVKSEEIFDGIECSSLEAFKLPSSIRARSLFVDEECSEVAMVVEGPEIEEEVELVSNTDSSDDVVEIQQEIPLIDLTKDAGEVNKDNFDSTEADLIRVLEETDKKIGKITLYRSEETLNDSMEIQTTSVTLTSTLEGPSKIAPLKSDSEVIALGSPKIDSAGKNTDEIVGISSNVPGSTEDSMISVNRSEENILKDSQTAAPSTTSADVLEKNNNTSVSNSSGKGPISTDASDALKLLVMEALSDSGSEKVNPEPVNVRTTQSQVTSMTRDNSKEMQADINQRRHVAVDNSIEVTMQEPRSGISTTVADKRNLPNERPGFVDLPNSNRNGEAASVDPINATADSTIRESSFRMDPSLSKQEYALSGIMVPYALFIISMKKNHENYFNNMKKDIPYVPHLLRTEINFQLRVFSKKLLFYGDLLCKDLTKLHAQGNMSTTTAQSTLKWIFETIRCYKPDSTMTSVVVSLYQVMQPHGYFFRGDSYLNTFYNVLDVYYGRLCGRFEAANLVQLSAIQRMTLEYQIHQYIALLKITQQMFSGITSDGRNVGVHSMHGGIRQQNSIIHNLLNDRPSTAQASKGQQTKAMSPILPNPSIRSLEKVVNSLPQNSTVQGSPASSNSAQVLPTNNIFFDPAVYWPISPYTYLRQAPAQAAPASQTASKSISAVQHPSSLPRNQLGCPKDSPRSQNNIAATSQTPANSFRNAPSAPVHRREHPAERVTKSTLAVFRSASLNALKEFRRDSAAKKPPSTSSRPTEFVAPPNPPRSTIRARDVHQDTPFHIPAELEAPTNMLTRSSDVPSGKQSFEATRDKAPGALRNFDHTKSPHPSFAAARSSPSDVPSGKQSFEATRDKAPVALRNFDHTKSPHASFAAARGSPSDVPSGKQSFEATRDKAPVASQSFDYTKSPHPSFAAARSSPSDVPSGQQTIKDTKGEALPAASRNLDHQSPLRSFAAPRNPSSDASSEATIEVAREKAPGALRNLDHIKSPVYAPMLFSPPQYEQDDSVPECSDEAERVMETIDLTWIDEVDDEEIQKEMDFIVKKEEPDEDEVILNQERFPVSLSPADSGIQSPSTNQGELIYIDRRCICENPAVYLCKCRTVMYCSAPCQKKDWSEHKSLCQEHT